MHQTRIHAKLQRLELALDGCNTVEGTEMLTRWIQQWQLTLHLRQMKQHDTTVDSMLTGVCRYCGSVLPKAGRGCPCSF